MPDATPPDHPTPEVPTPCSATPEHVISRRRAGDADEIEIEESFEAIDALLDAIIDDVAPTPDDLGGLEVEVDLDAPAPTGEATTAVVTSPPGDHGAVPEPVDEAELASLIDVLHHETDVLQAEVDAAVAPAPASDVAIAETFDPVDADLAGATDVIAETFDPVEADLGDIAPDPIDVAPAPPSPIDEPDPSGASSDPVDGRDAVVTAASSVEPDRLHEPAEPATPPEPVAPLPTSITDLDATMAVDVEGMIAEDGDAIDALFEEDLGYDADPIDASDVVAVPVVEMEAAVTPETEPAPVAEPVDEPSAEPPAAPAAVEVEVEPAVPEPVATPVASEAPAPDLPPIPDLPPTRLEAILMMVRQGLVHALMGLNFPLRLLPGRMRPLVDLLALTMIFWVPVVWALTLFVFRG